MKRLLLLTPIACLALNGCIALGGIGVAGQILAGAAAGIAVAKDGPAAARVVHAIATRQCRLVELWKCPNPDVPDPKK